VSGVADGAEARSELNGPPEITTLEPFERYWSLLRTRIGGVVSRLRIFDGRVNAVTVFAGELVAPASFEMEGGQRVNSCGGFRAAMGALGDGIGVVHDVTSSRTDSDCGLPKLSGRKCCVWEKTGGLIWSALGRPVDALRRGLEVDVCDTVAVDLRSA